MSKPLIKISVVFRLLSFLLVQFVLHASARAGHYDVTYAASGTFTVTFGVPATQAFTANSGTQICNGYWYTSSLGGSCRTNNASITATATWVPAYVGDDPPASVIVKEASTVSFTGSGSFIGPGSLSNGLGESQSAPGSGSWVSLQATGLRYAVEGGASFQKTITPSITVGHVYFPSSSSTAVMSIGYSMAVAPVEVSVAVTVPDSDDMPAMLIGQRATGTLSCAFPEVDFSGWAWTVPGATYQKWTIEPGQDDAYVVPVPGTEWALEHPSWRWKEPAGVDTYTVSCTAVATVPGELNDSVSAEKKIRVYEPYWSFASTKDIVSYTSGFTLVYAGSPGVPGMHFEGRVGTPSLFSGQGTGAWEFGQLIDMYRAKTTTSGVLPPYATYGYWLDNSWPYGTGIAGLGPAHFSAALYWDPGLGQWRGTFGETEDSPGTGLTNVLEYTVNDFFKMYQMYQPPSNLNNSPGLTDASDWAPLNRFNWKWFALDSRTSDSDPFTSIPPGTVTNLGSTARPEFPYWEHKYTNHMVLP